MITGTVIGSEIVVANFHGASARVREAMKTSVGVAAAIVRRRARDHYLNGAALHVRSGNLGRSVVIDGPQVSGNEITATVGTNSVYGKFWERGFSGEVKVRGHIRKVKTRDTTGIVKIRALKTRTNIKWGTTSEGVGFVKAHKYQLNVQPRPFLAPALADSREAVRLTIHQGLTRAFAGGR